MKSAPLTDAGGDNICTQVNDVTSKKQAEEVTRGERMFRVYTELRTRRGQGNG